MLKFLLCLLLISLFFGVSCYLIRAWFMFLQWDVSEGLGFALWMGGLPFYLLMLCTSAYYPIFWLYK